MINKQIREHIISIIENMNDMTMISFREDNFPQSTILRYVNDGFTIYCKTNKFSQKSINIKIKNRVFIIINHYYKNMDDIESLSIDAVAQLTKDKNEIEKVCGLMVKKFPEITPHKPSEFHDVDFYRIEPEAISLLDDNQGFGYLEYVPL